MFHSATFLLRLGLCDLDTVTGVCSLWCLTGDWLHMGFGVCYLDPVLNWFFQLFGQDLEGINSFHLSQATKHVKMSFERVYLLKSFTKILRSPKFCFTLMKICLYTMFNKMYHYTIYCSCCLPLDLFSVLLVLGLHRFWCLIKYP